MLVQQGSSPPQISHSSQKAYFSALRQINNQSDDEKQRKRMAQATYAKKLLQKIEDRQKRSSDYFAAQNDFSNQKMFTFGNNNYPSQNSNNWNSDLKGNSSNQPSSQYRNLNLVHGDLSKIDEYCSKNPNNDSPFAYSTVPTPPPGFSMRPLQAIRPTAVYNPSSNNNTNNSNNFNNNNNNNNKMSSGPAPKFEPTLKKTNSVDFDIKFQDMPSSNAYLHKIPGKFKNSEPKLLPSKSTSIGILPANPVASNNHLSTQSELVYPDGHFSPISTTRDS